MRSVVSCWLSAVLFYWVFVVTGREFFAEIRRWVYWDGPKIANAAEWRGDRSVRPGRAGRIREFAGSSFLPCDRWRSPWARRQSRFCGRAKNAADEEAFPIPSLWSF